LGFGTFSQPNPTITFIVADTFFGDNGGQFVLTQAAPTPPPIAVAVPTLGQGALIALAALLGVAGIVLRGRPRA
ncbi:MAG: IPTL-CTERM sorting domain-containing protein, partial [Rudaea sp.]